MYVFYRGSPSPQNPQSYSSLLSFLENMAGELRAILGISGVFVLFFFALPGPLVSAAGEAARSLF